MVVVIILGFFIRRSPTEKCRDHPCRPRFDHRRSDGWFGRERRNCNISSLAAVCFVARQPSATVPVVVAALVRCRSGFGARSVCQ